jgi:prepilin-type N-terminal cleavage/methylation domain-containing protein
MTHPTPRRRPRSVRRGFSLIELLVALAISAALLTATIVSLNACFIAYRSTTEEASTHTVSRLVMHRVLAMIRTGREFGPLPDDPLDIVVTSDEISFRDHSDQLITISFDEDDRRLLMAVDGGVARELLGGVDRTPTEDGAGVPAFTLEYEKGTHLYRVTMDLTVRTDQAQAVGMDAGVMRPIRLVASAMPRDMTAW